MNVAEREAILERAYLLFNARDVNALLAMMTDDIEWPDVANGVVLRDKDAIRSYWEGQFAVADPQVQPTEFIPVEDDLVAVVDQRVLDRRGEPITALTVVFHRYSFRDELVRRMVPFHDRREAVEAVEPS